MKLSIIAYFCSQMIRKRLILLFCFLLAAGTQCLFAQCSICTKTASQLGEGPAQALNSAIIYLAAAPFAIMGYIGWRWWKNEKQIQENS
jgi:hypothetical protein